MAFDLTGTDIESAPAWAKRCHRGFSERPARGNGAYFRRQVGAHGRVIADVPQREAL